jgi:small subunit ribosomal protein S4
MGIADSRKQARQLVRHGHFTVNGRKTNVPSFVVRTGDEVSIREGSRARTYFKDLDASGILRKKSVPEWLSVDPGAMSARVLRLPDRGELDLSINDQLIVEFYSR